MDQMFDRLQKLISQLEIQVRNKARLVARGHTQEEGIDYYEVFAHVARIEAIRRGTIDKTLFIKKDKGDILLVQVYVDDIIFGSTKKSLCDEFEGLMHKRFQMSSMGELTFFLGLQVQQKKDGIFISQDKYVADILKKFDFATVKTASTPMESNKALIKDEEADSVDVHLYRSMIGSLMYLIASRPDIMFVVCACARFQVTPKMSHLHAVKRIFRYLKGQPKLGLWYPRDSPFDLEAFSDSDYARASLDRKSTTGGCQFLGKRLISWQCKKQTIVANSTTKAEYVAAANCCGQGIVKVALVTMATRNPWGCYAQDRIVSLDRTDDDMEDVEGETVHTATTRVSAVCAPVTTAGVAISTVEPRTPPTTAATAFIDEDLTNAQTLIKMKEEKSKEKGVAIKDGVLVEEELEKLAKVKRRDQGLAQIECNAELAQRLHKEELVELDRAQKERQKQEEATSATLLRFLMEIISKSKILSRVRVLLIQSFSTSSDTTC
ncbi:putative ribonuclease H-like domain-containing protein [Tanacetum coccineum]|uniref:Ribonuclease H-like domain-containing protein n=1 Tax=Tanacetum coccineum TaxID=301880 RepID=A0ABQ5FZG7_9ASTR